jgi:hypothetical protein
MENKIKNRIKESKYRKTRIDRHNTPVNKFLDEAIANKKSVTRAIHELLDREAQLEAQLRQSEQDKMNEVHKICDVIFKTMLPDHRRGQLSFWMAAFNRKFIMRDTGFDIQKVFDAIDDIDRENAFILIKNAKPIKGKV